MSLSKVERANYGPGWGEVILGAVLCALLGVLLACLHLMFKPVATVTKLPDPKIPAGQLTYIEGTKDSYKGQGWTRKRQAFLGGQSIDLIEDELNVAVMIPSEKPAPAPDPGTLKQKKKEEPKAPADEPYVVPGSLNFRIADNLLQVSMPFRIPLMDTTVIVQAKGSFKKGGSGQFEYAPEQFYIGSLPVHMIPGVTEEAVRRAMQSEAIPADMKEAWAKVVDVRIEGRTLKVDMP